MVLIYQWRNQIKNKGTVSDRDSAVKKPKQGNYPEKKGRRERERKKDLSEDILFSLDLRNGQERTREDQTKSVTGRGTTSVKAPQKKGASHVPESPKPGKLGCGG